MKKFQLLSPRENEVAHLLLEGKSNKQIALSLGVSIRTVEFHLRNIFAKLEVGSRVELVLKLGEATKGASTNPVESTVVIPDKKVHNGNQPARESWSQSLKNLKVVIKKEIVMTLRIMSQDSGNFLRKHPLFFGLLLFLTASLMIRYVVMDLGLYYWLSYILLAVLLGAGGILLGLAWRKIRSGEIQIHPLGVMGMAAALPLLAAISDQVFLHTIVRQTGPITLSIAGMSMKAIWGVSPLGEMYLSTQRSFISEQLWFIAVGYILLFFLIGVLSGNRTRKMDLASISL
jgi:DNA-binding CsgD family transcriptional regulator